MGVMVAMYIVILISPHIVGVIGVITDGKTGSVPNGDGRTISCINHPICHNRGIFLKIILIRFVILECA